MNEEPDTAEEQGNADKNGTCHMNAEEIYTNKLDLVDGCTPSTAEAMESLVLNNLDVGSQCSGTTKRKELLNVPETNDKPYTCFLCDSACADKYLFVSHILEHFKNESDTVEDIDDQNGVCSMDSGQQTEDSADEPSDDSECKISCRICGEFLFGNSLQTHLREKHIGNDTCQQTICNNNLSDVSKDMLNDGDSRGGLNTSSRSSIEVVDLDMDDRDYDDSDFIPSCQSSLQQYGTATQEVLCQICFKSILRADVESHFKEHHRNSSKMQCKICDRLISKSTRMKRHMAVHEKTTDRYKCNVCNKSFTRIIDLSEHIDNNDLGCKEYFHFKKSYDCKLCNSKFILPSALRVHRKICHRIIPTKDTSCSYQDPNILILERTQLFRTDQNIMFNFFNHTYCDQYLTSGNESSPQTAEQQ